MDERPLLILDLDETLIWARESLREAPYDFRACQYYVTRRPFLAEFLAAVFEWFRVAVWTSSGEQYADAVVSELFGRTAPLEFVWNATRCTQRLDEETGVPCWLKDLGRVKRKGFPLERVLVIDDSPEKLRRHYGNRLPVSPFEGNEDDRELADVLPFLDWIRLQENFRKIEKRDWRLGNWTRSRAPSKR
jgi:RNA polymerase II subunit A small phosphatase-like protein